jgi:predicted transcriptional regulator
MTTVVVTGGPAMTTDTPATIGDQELALLRFVAERGGASVGEAAEGFGAPRGLARSTVLTMMERLRAKGYLGRRPEAGVYRYGASAPAGEVVRGLVGSFVERTLGGSVAPLAAYLAERTEVSAEELAELEAAVARLAERRREPGA